MKASSRQGAWSSASTRRDSLLLVTAGDLRGRWGGVCWIPETDQAGSWSGSSSGSPTPSPSSQVASRAKAGRPALHLTRPARAPEFITPERAGQVSWSLAGRGVARGQMQHPTKT